MTGQHDRLTGVLSVDGGHIEGSRVTGQQVIGQAVTAWLDLTGQSGRQVNEKGPVNMTYDRTGHRDRSPRGQPLTGQPDRTARDFPPPWRAQDVPVSKVAGSVNGWRTARVLDGPFLLSGQRWRLMIDPDATVGTLGDPGHDRIGTLLAETGPDRWRMVRVQRCDVSELLCEARKDKRNAAYVTDSIVASILANPERRRDERRPDR